MVNNKKVDRARQFLPFDALKGYKEAIQKKQLIIADKKDISEDDAKALNYKLIQIKVGMMVKVIYYKDNNYVALEGLVSKIDIDNLTLTIVKTKINILDIINVSGEQIKEYEID